MIEKRKHVRFEPTGLLAIITIYPPFPHEKILLQGVVLDMSGSGIRIKLFSAMPTDIPESKMEINLTLPKSAFPIAIKGVIRHVNPQSEIGFKFADDNEKQEVDDLLFECIKMTTPSEERVSKH
ncbi:MAG: hypothetical protein ACJA13_003209 [Paraglaciecola sp.]|jgi:hypothetical protein